jgi:hypothetical protein
MGGCSQYSRRRIKKEETNVDTDSYHSRNAADFVRWNLASAVPFPTGTATPRMVYANCAIGGAGWDADWTQLGASGGAAGQLTFATVGDINGDTHFIFIDSSLGLLHQRDVNVLDRPQ